MIRHTESSALVSRPVSHSLQHCPILSINKEICFCHKIPFLRGMDELWNHHDLALNCTIGPPSLILVNESFN